MPVLFERQQWPGIWAVAILLTGFLAMVTWFDTIDFYHRHFFSTGFIVAADNMARLFFVVVFAWLVYAPGAAVTSLITSRETRAELTPLERAVLGFGLGIGLWHVLMLVLGVAGLYWRNIMAGVCLAVLLASASHLAAVVNAATQLARPRGLRLGGIVLFVGAAALLLLVRGLYPGGGGDYYTHYFPYYLAVLDKHGLAPNDVWYHYYYSKGYGLFFLGMLLTDPEAPALVTFCSVVVAAAAMLALAARIAPGSLWPLCGALLYLLANLIELGGSGAGGGGSGGEFQKDHEISSALVVLVAWGAAMAHGKLRRPCLTMASSSAVAAAIIAQPMGIILAFYLALLGALAAVFRRWAEMLGYAACAIVAGASVLGMFVLGYVETGLASDQPLDLMLRFIDPARLDQWGVVPQVVVVAWLRDVYRVMSPHFDWRVLDLLSGFTRLDVLWTFLVAPALALVLIAIYWCRNIRSPAQLAQPAGPLRALVPIAVLVAVMMLIALVSGSAQYVSFFRFSSFFVPLLLLLGIALCGWATGRVQQPWVRWCLNWPMPAAALVATLCLWQSTANWTQHVAHATARGMRFLVGNYSLAEAYAHQDEGLPFGGINPEALAAWRHSDQTEPIWSTNVAAYCMVPGCHIESVVSFKMSARLDQIVTQSPERAKALLQEAGLNQFLFLNDQSLLDLLPYSKLFAPDTIGKYLGVKWSDGVAYLLTWSGPGTRPLDQDFIKAYTGHLTADDMRWFRFPDLVPQMPAAAARLRSATLGHRLDFGFTGLRPPEGGIQVADATYGRLCRRYRPQPPAINLFSEGNATDPVQWACNGKLQCDFVVAIPPLVDPASGCDKDIEVTYRCPDDQALRTVAIEKSTYGKTLHLDCTAPR